jgi:hypothetical protein
VGGQRATIVGDALERGPRLGRVQRERQELDVLGRDRDEPVIVTLVLADRRAEQRDRG